MNNETPQDYQTEQLVLGACLKDPEVISTVLVQLRMTDFFNLKHRTIYTAISSLETRGEPVDISTTYNELKKISPKDKDMRGYLVELADECINSPTANIEYWCRIVREYAQLRGVINTFEQLLDKCRKGQEPARKLVDEAETAIMEANTGNSGDTFDSISHASELVINDVESTLRGEKRFVISGYNDLDNILHGFADSNLYLIAGRPGMAKTSLAMNIAENVGKTKTVGFMSLEMGKEQLAERLLFSTAGVPIAKSKPTFNEGEVIPPALTEEDNRNLLVAKEKLDKLKIEIDDTPALDIQTLRSKAKQLKSKCGIELLIVDYIQLMAGVGNNRTEAVGEISRGLKIIAKELHIPVIALSQLSRALESRPDKRPQLSDLRDSGSLEQDADAVIFLFREEMYKQHLDPQDPNRLLVEGKAELIIGKNRHGKTGIIHLAWLGDRTRFENLSFKTEDIKI